MADKGFLLADLLESRGHRLVIPHFLASLVVNQMSLLLLHLSVVFSSWQSFMNE